MASHSSATAHEHTLHTLNSVTNNSLNQLAMRDALRRRAASVLRDKSVDGGSRAIIRYALEINDPMLSELVQQAEDGESIGNDISGTITRELDSLEQKIEALTEIICRAGEDHHMRTAALLVLLASVENSADARALANTAKHFAFFRCAEMNVFGMVDAQVAMLERELFAANPHLT